MRDKIELGFLEDMVWVRCYTLLDAVGIRVSPVVINRP